MGIIPHRTKALSVSSTISTGQVYTKEKLTN